MSAPINLNNARKARARADRKARATENVVRFGRTKAEKQAEKVATDRASMALDGKAIVKPQQPKSDT